MYWVYCHTTNTQLNFISDSGIAQYTEGQGQLYAASNQTNQRYCTMLYLSAFHFSTLTLSDYS